MHGQRVLVLGASGWIGRPLALKLAEENDVDGLGLFPSEAVKDSLEQGGVRIMERDIVRDGLAGVPTNYDYVFSELAALPNLCNTNLPVARAINITFVGKMISHFRAARGIVHASTASLYRPSSAPLEEDAPPGPWDVYNSTKLGGEAVAMSMAEEYGVPITIPRYFFPYLGTRGAICGPIRLVAEGSPVPHNPQASVKRNPIHMDDLVRLTIESAKICGVPAQFVNIAGADVIDDVDVARRTAEILGKEASFLDVDVPPPFWGTDFWWEGRLAPLPSMAFYNIDGSSISWLADTTRLNVDVGTPSIRLDEGIQRCLDALAHA
jgi:nucleoside-diphosphate-sugar epimerase